MDRVERFFWIPEVLTCISDFFERIFCDFLSMEKLFENGVISLIHDFDEKNMIKQDRKAAYIRLTERLYRASTGVPSS
jgi:hypothetical protein